jgi:hypothetical protein
MNTKAQNLHANTGPSLLVSVALAFAFVCISVASASWCVAADRPFFMPPAERSRIVAAIASEPWAAAEHATLSKAADRGDGYAAALLYALQPSPARAAVAQKWLLSKFGSKAFWTVTATKRLAGDFFFGGQPNISEVYYDTDIKPYLAFDWVWGGLEPASRAEIAEGMLVFARYKMRAMDRWTQTANLVFKPTAMVTMAGLALDNAELKAWGLKRLTPWGPHLGGMDVVLPTMIRDGGPWAEAPIYAIAHTVLQLTAEVSRWRGLAEGRDIFSTPGPGAASGKGLMDYYLDTAYPIEQTGAGAGQVRIANYGDGSTNGSGDLFLVNPAEPKGSVVAEGALAAAYAATRDPGYGALLALSRTYRPNLIDRPPLPAKPELPPAPSRIWPVFGAAMLRSDETPAYWTSGNAIAVLQLMSQGYGHQHNDHFGITLHGAGRLFYPSYNAIQYENPHIGWTRNTQSHSTLVVDEQESRNVAAPAIRHVFTPDVKILVTSADGVFVGVAQTRALVLAREYLLDVVRAASVVPRIYDYVLHSFGKVEPPRPDAYEPGKPLERRYWLVEYQRSLQTKERWSLDFRIKDERGTKPAGYGATWYEHDARLRLTMAPEPGTEVVLGRWGEELARLVAEAHNGGRLDRLSTVVARRAGTRETVFASTHEPVVAPDIPVITDVAVVARGRDAAVVRVTGRDWVDYAAITFGRDGGAGERVLADPHSGAQFGFEGQAWLRLGVDGRMRGEGGWTRLRLPGAKGPLTIGGKPREVTLAGGALVLGDAAPHPVVATFTPDPEPPIRITHQPSLVRIWERDRRRLQMMLENPGRTPVSGSVAFELPPGFSVDPAPVAFGPIEAGGKRVIFADLVASGPTAGPHVIPYRATTSVGGAGPVRSGALRLDVAVGPTLDHVYEHPAPYYRVAASGYSARFGMRAGLAHYLTDNDDVVRLDGEPLFTISDGTRDLLSSATKKAFTWPVGTPASVTASSEDRIRWQAICLPDRITVRMIEGWTSIDRAYFQVPGRWISPQGEPVWHRVVFVDDSGREVEAAPDRRESLKVAAAELAFPRGGYNLGFQFTPPQEVVFEGTGLRFALDVRKNESWHIGFVVPGQFDVWRGKR